VREPVREEAAGREERAVGEQRAQSGCECLLRRGDGAVRRCLVCAAGQVLGERDAVSGLHRRDGVHDVVVERDVRKRRGRRGRGQLGDRVKGPGCAVVFEGERAAGVGGGGELTTREPIMSSLRGVSWWALKNDPGPGYK
jgi:hypothetical protein